MSTRDDRAQAATPNAEPWTIPGVARELVVILSASAGIITLLMLLKSAQSLF
jgi:hypothetical protein